MPRQLVQPYEKRISVAKLLLDVENPRLPTIQQDQVHALKTMIGVQGPRITALAEHIVEHGLNPATMLIVMPASGKQGDFVVLDGNRRFSAIRALENPSLAHEVLPDSATTKLKQLSVMFRQHPIQTLRCIVFDDRDAADTWIQLIHRGANQGAGLVAWDGQVAAEYDKRRGNRKSGALQILDAVRDDPNLSEETRRLIAAGKYPVTNLDRLINTPYVRKRLGIDKIDGSIILTHSSESVVKGLAKVVDDIGTREITVTNIKTQEQRIDYINGLSNSQLPDPKSTLPIPLPLTAVSNSGTSPAISAPKPNSSIGKGRKPRNTLIPYDCRLVIPEHRIENIFKELKRLNIDEFPNAGAVMLRVFLELSLDCYLEKKVGWPSTQIDNSQLSHKLGGCIKHLETNGVLNAHELVPVKKTMGGQTLLAASVNTLHAYVHNRHSSPLGSELRTAWDDLQPFFVGLWKG